MGEVEKRENEIGASLVLNFLSESIFIKYIFSVRISRLDHGGLLLLIMIFRALCYKNCILWKRNRCLSICETVLPITLTLLLVLMRVLITKEDSGEEQYLKKSMDFNFTYQYYYPNFY